MNRWIDVKKELPDEGLYVMTLCHRMGNNGETMIIVAKLLDSEWYSFFPWDQPVKPTHWCYTIEFKGNV